MCPIKVAEEIKNTSTKPWFKTWWGILVLLVLWPFSLTYWIWTKDAPKHSKYIAIGLLWFLVLGIALSNQNKKVTTNTPEKPSPTKQTAQQTLMPTKTPTPIATSEGLNSPTSTTARKVVKGSSPKGIELYNNIEALIKQGKIYGELYTEFESDPIVDVNPEMQSVQLSLKYSSIEKDIDQKDRDFISNDFKVIKVLVEQDQSLILPEYGTLRLFVLTYHDVYGEGRGELQQLMIDEVPQWLDW